MEKNNISLEYLAGLVDGEGCFCISKYTRSGRLDLHPYCGISLKEKWVLDRVQKFLGFGFVRKRSNGRANQADSFEFNCRSQLECLKFCELLIPSLILKKERAEILRDFINLRKGQKFERDKNNKKRRIKDYSPEQLDLLNRLKRLNFKGNGHFHIQNL